MSSNLALMTILSLLLGSIHAMSIGPADAPDDTIKVGVIEDVKDGSNAPCVIPPEDDLIRILTNSQDIFAHIPSDATEDEATQKNHTGDLHCPIGEPIPKSAPIRLRSVCPWELVDDFDANRYPKILQKAVCRCSNCLDPQSNQLNESLGCHPVYYPMPVLRRVGCKDGIATFESSFEQVAVACDCRAVIVKKTGDKNLHIEIGEAKSM